MALQMAARTDTPGTPTGQATSPASTASGGKAPVVTVRPFRVGVQNADDDIYDETRTMTTGTVQLPQYRVPPTGFLRYLLIWVKATGADNTSGADVAFAEDGPWNSIELKFLDTNNSEIDTPMTGWDLMIIDLFGSYTYAPDPRDKVSFTAVEGTGATAGTFSFILQLPLELVVRDALGAMPNKSNSTPFRLSLSLAPSTTVYDTEPDTALPDVRVRVLPESWWEPTAVDGSGNPVAPEPPAANTTQYWNKSEYLLPAGAVTQQLTNSTGYPVRNLIFVYRDTSDGTRATGETDWAPTPILQYQSNIMINRALEYWQYIIECNYKLNGISDAAGDKPYGVYMEPYCLDFGLQPGAETRRGYFRTTDGARLQLKGTFGAAGTLTVLTNYVGFPASASLASVTA